jgi:hypothetical protein
VAVTGERKCIQPGRRARVHLNGETVEDAQTALRAGSPRIEHIGVPVVVDIIVRERFAEVEETASGVSGEHKVMVLCQHIERGRRVVQSVPIPGHWVRCGDLPGDDVYEDCGPR